MVSSLRIGRSDSSNPLWLLFEMLVYQLHQVSELIVVVPFIDEKLADFIRREDFKVIAEGMVGGFFRSINASGASCSRRPCPLRQEPLSFPDASRFFHFLLMLCEP